MKSYPTLRKRSENNQVSNWINSLHISCNLEMEYFIVDYLSFFFTSQEIACACRSSLARVHKLQFLRATVIWYGKREKEESSFGINF